MTGEDCELVARIFDSMIGALELFCLYIGDQLGFYRALHERGPATAPELSSRAGTNERYTREWLEQQATAGILLVDNPDASPGERRFRLPEEYGAVLTEVDSLSAATPMAQIVAGTVAPVQALLQGQLFVAEERCAVVPRPVYSPRPRLNRRRLARWRRASPAVGERLDPAGRR